MDTKTRKLARLQLDTTLKAFRPLKSIPVPGKGWIRAIRDVLGMSGRQLAHRMGTTKQAIDLIEQGEVSDAITFKSMQNAAEGLDCVFVYALVPKISLEETVLDQARQKAIQRLKRVDLTMLLENQSLSVQEKKKALNDAADDLLKVQNRTLWDE
ncbi:hypothetical protein AUK40_05090 [Candidatus Wirthbacteria bacterium CG2_30_54_11]|uniref:HTH cro/C1-type domain-containing protein n=1 Tax=Candidatus Wirthbacteria bacterium CG2_30_54_11 TaxID=1817892 RepID=A0A1J5II48_9BACT|nr:MAG: hypothetical protein AUK40_05090 [Candidatus Wirthbacteria bacterium CG2_30_54_11]